MFVNLVSHLQNLFYHLLCEILVLIIVHNAAEDHFVWWPLWLHRETTIIKINTFSPGFKLVKFAAMTIRKLLSLKTYLVWAVLHWQQICICRCDHAFFIVVNKSLTSNLSVVSWVIWPNSLQTGKNVFEKARICISAVLWSNNWGFCSQESFINLSTTSGKYLWNSWCVGRSWVLSCILGSSASRTAANPAGHLLCNAVPPLHLHT